MVSPEIVKKAILFSLVAGSIAYVACQFNSEPKSPPNVVIILCDDLGYGDLELYGNKRVHTPNINHLADQGMLFTSFYPSAPVCSPSRVGLLTGRNPNRAGVYDWIPPASNYDEELRDLVHMRTDESTLATQLKLIGYRTCFVGKWHCNSAFNSEIQPQPDHFGFDHWFATQNNAYPNHHNPVNFVRNGNDVGPLDGFSCQIITEEAIHWLDSTDNGSPFYIQVSFHEPHEPVASPNDLVQKYLNVSLTEDQATYFANIENVDLAVGRLMDALSERGLDKNTMVLFTSDNGPETLNRYSGANRSYGSPGNLQGMKLWTTEGGIRVPGIIRWPEKIEAGSICNIPVSALDIMPTVCKMSGAPLPEKAIDGADISSLFITREEFVREKPLLWCYYHAINERRVAMRHNQWKIMAKLCEGRLEMDKTHNLHLGNIDEVNKYTLADFTLYDMVNDSIEAQDVSNEFPAEYENLKMLLTNEYEALLEDSHIWSRTPID